MWNITQPASALIARQTRIQNPREFFPQNGLFLSFSMFPCIRNGQLNRCWGPSTEASIVPNGSAGTRPACASRSRTWICDRHRDLSRVWASSHPPWPGIPAMEHAPWMPGAWWRGESARDKNCQRADDGGALRIHPAAACGATWESRAASRVSPGILNPGERRQSV